MKNQKKNAHSNLFNNLLIIPMVTLMLIPCSAQTAATSNTKSSSDTITKKCVMKCSSQMLSDKPLYIIDGKPATDEEVKALKPDGIKEINVLKDASATALYGTRGANGVVIITLKK